MGCDIHVYLEYQPFPGTSRPFWEHLASGVNVSRDYALFALLAGVRNRRGITPISPPRGLPAQLSFPTAQAWEGEEGDGHDASYLTYHEIEAVQQAYARLEGQRAEVRWVRRDQAVEGGWTLYERDAAVPHDLLVPPPPPAQVSAPDAWVIAVRRTPGPFEAHLELGAILAFLAVYEEAGMPTRMVFWFDN